MKGKTKRKKIQIPLYFGEITLIQSKDLRPLEKEYNLEPIFDCVAFCWSYEDNDGYKRYLLAFEESITPSIVAHEACHLVNRIFKDVGIELDLENDENQCYLLGWIVNECHGFLWDGL